MADLKQFAEQLVNLTVKESGEYSGEYDQWAMPVPELAAPYVDQTNATIPPSFLHYGSSPFDMYNTQ